MNICGNCLYERRFGDSTAEPCKTCLSDDGEDQFVKETRTISAYFYETLNKEEVE